MVNWLWSSAHEEWGIENKVKATYSQAQAKDHWCVVDEITFKQSYSLKIKKRKKKT